MDTTNRRARDNRHASDLERRTLTSGQRRQFIRELREAKRKPLDPVESHLAEQVARRVGNLHEAGASWDIALADIDATWPSLPYRIAVVGLFWAQLIFEKKRRGRVLHPFQPIPCDVEAAS